MSLLKKDEYLPNLFYAYAIPIDKYGQSLEFMKYQCDYQLACLRLLHQDPYKLITHIDVFEDDHLKVHLAYLNHTNGLLTTLHFMCDILAQFICQELGIIVKADIGIKFLKDMVPARRYPNLLNLVKQLVDKTVDLSNYVNCMKHHYQPDFNVVQFRRSSN